MKCCRKLPSCVVVRNHIQPWFNLSIRDSKSISLSGSWFWFTGSSSFADSLFTIELFLQAMYAVFRSFMGFFFKLRSYTDVSAFWISLYGSAQLMHTALCLPPPLLYSDIATLCSLLQGLLSALFWNGSNKVFLFSVNEEHLILFSFPKEKSTGQKLKAFLFLADLFCVSWAHELH